jgi:glyoxylase-like metal-dependent hydrolase (beta-lactamase superfamily II)
MMRSLVGPLMLLTAWGRAEAQPSTPLRIEVLGSAAPTFHVVSTLISGPREAVLFDAQYRPTDGARIADSIAVRGKRLTAIVISHADHDHYMGALAIVKRFPGTPIYATPSVRADFARRAAQDLALEKRRPGADVPDSLPVLEPLPANLMVDGHPLEVMDGFTGDVKEPASALLWVPSLKAALVGDLVFSGIHPWLGESDSTTRARWRDDLTRIKALGPAIVIPGHLRDPAVPHTVALVDSMMAYLDAFDAAARSSGSAEELVTRMTAAYPDRSLPILMAMGARRHFADRKPAP